MIDVHEHPGGVRELRLARPPVNALSPALIALLDRQLDAALAQSRAVVLSGQPGLFTAGLDVRELATLDHAGVLAFLQQFLAVQRRLAHSPVPVIAALTGHSPAGGTVLALFCDYRVLARGAFRVGLNEVQVGLTPGDIIFKAFERLVGPRIAADWAMRGLLVDSEAALAAGLVDELAAPEQVITRAVALAQELLALPQGAFAATRRTARSELASLFDERRSAALVEQVSALWFSRETRERMTLLLQKGPAASK